jgi:hypothetical protein
MSTKKNGSPSRRDFIKTAGLGVGVAAVASGVLSASGAEASPLVLTEETSGYRETEHVRKYYESAQF